jgi:hypothetical protein
MFFVAVLHEKVSKYNQIVITGEGVILFFIVNKSAIGF